MTSLPDDRNLLAEESLRLLDEILNTPGDTASALKDILAIGSQVIAPIEARAVDRANLWIDGIEPPPFDAFAIEIDGCPLYPRQHAAFEKSAVLSPYSVLEPRTLHQIVLVYGKGSGKDYVVAKFKAWLFLVLCSLKQDPAQFFGLAPSSRLSIINVASTKDQARNVFFAQYLARFLKHKMFDRFLRVGNGTLAFGKANLATGKETADMIVHYRTDLNGIRYECIGIYSMHSRAASLEGHNVFAWTMDEADAFHDSAEKSNAQEVYDVLRSSSQRFQRNWFGMIISYPRVEEGFMMRLFDRARRDMEAKGALSGYFADLGASWEINPRFDRDNPDVVEMYETDFKKANAVYGCVPMATEDGFFEFPEKIAQAVDPNRSPVAIVTEETIDLPLRHGGEMYYVTGKVGLVNPVPGYAYFLSGDAGHKKDSYSLCVMHYDSSPEGYAWLCPECSRERSLMAGAQYVLQLLGTREKITQGREIRCGVCLNSPADYGGGWNRLEMNVGGWYKRDDRNESFDIDAGGHAYNVPHLYEDLIVAVKPRRASSSDVRSESGRNRTIYFPGMRDVCRQLIETLGIRAARFDPWQTVEVTQELVALTGADVAEISYSNVEQYRRAKFYKRMLYSGYLTLLPNEKRDRELRRLQRIGDYRIDHPDGETESKDLFDAESACIWTAAKHRDSRLEMLFL